MTRTSPTAAGRTRKPTIIASPPKHSVRAASTVSGAGANLARIVDKPRRRDRAIRKEIKELEGELEYLADIASHGAASPEDFDEADAIREKLDRRLRALAGQRGMPPDPPPSSPPRP